MNNDALYDKPYPLNFVFNFSLLIRDYSRVHEYAGCDDDWGGGQFLIILRIGLQFYIINFE